jgi:hypothetical protein
MSSLFDAGLVEVLDRERERDGGLDIVHRAGRGERVKNRLPSDVPYLTFIFMPRVHFSSESNQNNFINQSSFFFP